MAFLVNAPPCVVHEDEHLLIVNKPAGINTHCPSPHAGEGIYEWLKNREPRWSALATIHRLDKGTSGLIVFARSPRANRSLTDQFARRHVRKRYLLLTHARPARERFVIRNKLARAGDRYVPSEAGDFAETRFEYLKPSGDWHLLAAEPLTGRTHQIRVHAQLSGIPILGDSLYGGEPFARLCLHAEQLAFHHPEQNQPRTFSAPVDFFENPALAARRLMIDPAETNAFRLIHGTADGHAGPRVERWGSYLLAMSQRPLEAAELEFARDLKARCAAEGLYFKLSSSPPGAQPEEAAPVLIDGKAAPESFPIRENGVRFEISFQRGCSVGLFLDQRENRRRVLTGYISPGFTLDPLHGGTVLNTFAYTCGFSVCAALAGARVTSIDLSRKSLEWGKRNFALNQLDLGGHEFIQGDVFDWSARLARKERCFDLILLDPPTFSRARTGGVFQAENDYGRLAGSVLPLLRRNGVLFASSNTHKLAPEAFLAQVRGAVARARRTILAEKYFTQPFDFPISKEEPAYLKTVWMRIG